ncbi:Uu.00g141670.m01.CDS01, partial [Anthostomella pinea]
MKEGDGVEVSYNHNKLQEINPEHPTHVVDETDLDSDFDDRNKRDVEDREDLEARADVGSTPNRPRDLLVPRGVCPY